MLPILHFSSLQISTYALMYGLAFIVGGLLVLRRVSGPMEEDRLLRNSLVLLVLFIFIGLFLPSIAESYIKSWLTGQPREPYHMRVYYGLALGLLVCLLYLRWMKLSFLRLMDRVIPVFALAFAIARVGCLAAGCCGGAVTTSFMGMYAPDEDGVWATRYPTQMMSMGFELLLYFVLTMLQKRRRGWLKIEGAIFYLYIILFCVERFTLEWLRADYHPLFGPLSLPHLYMLFALVAVGVGFVSALKRNYKMPLYRPFKF